MSEVTLSPRTGKVNAASPFVPEKVKFWHEIKVGQLLGTWETYRVTPYMTPANFDPLLPPPPAISMYCLTTNLGYFFRADADVRYASLLREQG